MSFLQAELATSAATLRALGSAYHRASVLLRKEAVLSYADAASSVGPDQLSGSFYSVEDRSTYFTVAVGDLSQTLTQFRAARSALAATVAARNHQLRADLATEDLAAEARSQALAKAASLQVMLSQAEAQAQARAQARAGPARSGNARVGSASKDRPTGGKWNRDSRGVRTRQHRRLLH